MSREREYSTAVGWSTAKTVEGGLPASCSVSSDSFAVTRRVLRPCSANPWDTSRIMTPWALAKSGRGSYDGLVTSANRQSTFSRGLPPHAVPPIGPAPAWHSLMNTKMALVELPVSVSFRRIVTKCRCMHGSGRGIHFEGDPTF